MSTQKKTTVLQWVAIGMTVVVTVSGWISVGAADKRETQVLQANTLRDVEQLKEFRITTERDLAEMKTDVRWIRQEMERRKP